MVSRFVAIAAGFAIALVGCGSAEEPKLTAEQEQRSRAAGAEAQSKWSPEMVEKFKQAKAPDVAMSDKNASSPATGPVVAADEGK